MMLACSTMQGSTAIDKPASGPTIWGTETLQYRKSVLSNVPARRFLNLLKIAYADGLDYNVFDPNNQATRFEVTQMGIGLLQPYQDSGAIFGYEIVCDERNNTDEVMDAEALIVRFYVKFTPIAKRILLEAVLMRTGASFSEQIALDSAA
jgi:phage tail sheath protein FI